MKQQRQYVTDEDFLKASNQWRLQSKGLWVFYAGIVSNRRVEYKAYGTWVQILRIDGGVNHASAMDINVGDYRNHMEEAFEYESRKETA